MYQYFKGEYINYSGSGVCLISEIGVPNFDKSSTDLYYILNPVEDKSTTIFVPANNHLLLSRMRKLLTKEEIDELIDSIKHESIEWIDDRKKRTETFGNIIKQNDPFELLKVIACIYKRKEQLSKYKGSRKLSFSDLDFLERTERLIEGEFSFVLGIPPFDIAGYIRKKIGI